MKRVQWGSEIRPFENRTFSCLVFWMIYHLKIGHFFVRFFNTIWKLDHLGTNILSTIQKPDMSDFWIPIVLTYIWSTKCSGIPTFCINTVSIRFLATQVPVVHIGGLQPRNNLYSKFLVFTRNKHKYKRNRSVKTIFHDVCRVCWHFYLCGEKLWIIQVIVVNECFLFIVQ